MHFTKMFSICTKFESSKHLQYLQAGNYLCYICSENEKEEVIQEMMSIAREKHGIEPDYIILNVKFTGMFQWKYEVQLLLE
ncbi:hypothetical protein [Gottschalkia acidurici]|nr:hypothetical protein [Gottschalkia acidurici]